MNSNCWKCIKRSNCKTYLEKISQITEDVADKYKEALRRDLNMSELEVLLVRGEYRRND